MDTQAATLEKILHELHAKFSTNQEKAMAHTGGAQRPDGLSNVFFHVSEFLLSPAERASHEILLAKYIKEVFADLVCVTYLAYSGLDTPARILIRRALELSYVVLAYYDNPAKFWDWNEKDKDISFSELEAVLASDGYIIFLEKNSPLDIEKHRQSINFLREAYRQLSNVVHPKPYNFETALDNSFNFDPKQLKKILGIQEEVQKNLLILIFNRFPEATNYVERVRPNIKQELNQ